MAGACAYTSNYLVLPDAASDGSQNTAKKYGPG